MVGVRLGRWIARFKFWELGKFRGFLLLPAHSAVLPAEALRSTSSELAKLEVLSDCQGRGQVIGCTPVVYC